MPIKGEGMNYGVAEVIQHTLRGLGHLKGMGGNGMIRTYRNVDASGTRGRPLLSSRRQCYST